MGYTPFGHRSSGRTFAIQNAYAEDLVRLVFQVIVIPQMITSEGYICNITMGRIEIKRIFK